MQTSLDGDPQFVGLVCRRVSRIRSYNILGMQWKIITDGDATGRVKRKIVAHPIQPGGYRSIAASLAPRVERRFHRLDRRIAERQTGDLACRHQVVVEQG